MLRPIESVPASRSTSSHRNPHSSPRRKPVTIVSQTSTAQSGSFDASSRIRAASAAVGGRGFGAGCGGASAFSIGFRAIQPHRTARLNAPERMTWIWRIVDFDSGRHLCRPHRLSHLCSSGVR